KGVKYGEIEALEKLGTNIGRNIKVKQYGKRCFIETMPSDEDVAMANRGLAEVTEAICSGKYDLVILDEINMALYFNLLTLEDVLNLIEIKPDNVELVFTGRRAEKEIIERADLVTEMREIKHYFTRGVMARNGIEK
ncbi:MAG: cob(I)yrinic acid a,c-diamide adenosyltransferase, partial [Actinobacteria bacterium]|nr:cob(I)yrinic acid a,c-diamide adenosyltransferase [Actinomycetota bacterium]